MIPYKLKRLTCLELTAQGIVLMTQQAPQLLLEQFPESQNADNKRKETKMIINDAP